MTDIKSMNLEELKERRNITIVPFENTIPKTTELYKIMQTD